MELCQPCLDMHEPKIAQQFRDLVENILRGLVVNRSPDDPATKWDWETGWNFDQFVSGILRFFGQEEVLEFQDLTCINFFPNGKVLQSVELGVATIRFPRTCSLACTRTRINRLLEVLPKIAFVLSWRVMTVGRRRGWILNLDVMKRILTKLVLCNKLLCSVSKNIATILVSIVLQRLWVSLEVVIHLLALFGTNSATEGVVVVITVGSGCMQKEMNK